MRRISKMRSIAIVLAACLSSCSIQSIEVDVLIIGGTIIDGTGNESYEASIGINADTIAFIGEVDHVRASKTIDVTGLIISPGFIDPHTHAEGELRNEDKCSNINYLTQGVTTVFVGNDGGGPFDIDEAADQLSTKGIGTNVAFFVGHGVVRNEVLGINDVTPDETQLDAMKKLVRQGMETGAFGLSTGLYYVPGSYATTEEVIELTKEIVPYNGAYDSHIRDESSYNVGLIAAVEEVLRIGRESAAPVHFAHIKALGVDVWGKSDEIIQMITKAQRDGIKVSADQYPWSASGTRLQNALVNGWVKDGGDERYYQRLKDSKLLPRIKLEMKENIRKRGGAESLLITGGYEEDDIIGKNLKEISAYWQLDEVEAALRICRNGGARIASFNMNDSDIENFMAQDWVMTCSDGSTGHPRKFASYPRKYQQYVEAKKVLDLPTFVYKSSGLVAETFGIKKRGKLAVGNYADIAILDLSNYQQVADFSDPELLSTGVAYLLVNGKLTIEDSEYNGTLGGRVIRKNE